MTAEQAGLLATIRESPDDDTPRLVYADWLTENGFVEWAAFIRSSCQLANPDRHGLTLGQLVEVEADFHRLMTNRKLFITMPGIVGVGPYITSWNGDLFAPEIATYEFEQPDTTMRLTFRRGFVVGVAGDLDDVRAHLPALLRHHTIERAVPLDYLEEGLDRELPEDLDRFVDEWASPDTVPDDVFDDPAKYFSHVLIAESRGRIERGEA